MESVVPFLQSDAGFSAARVGVGAAGGNGAAAGLPASLAESKGEELQKAVKESQEVLKTLEKALEGKRFFGGDSFGYLDIVIGWIAYMLPMLEDIAGVSVVNEESLPLMKAWFDLVLDVQVGKESLLPKDKLYDLNRKRREQLLTEQMSSNN